MRIRVTLTQTSNQYLTPALPLVGELEIHETNLVGGISNASFRIELLNGELAAPVFVRHVAFTFGDVAEPEYPAGRKALPTWHRHAARASQLWDEEERRENAYVQRAGDLAEAQVREIDARKG